jgi:hypothetical protein
MVLLDGLSILAGQEEGVNSNTMRITVLFSAKLMFLPVIFSSYGLGNRIKLAYTRKIIDAIHSGSLLNVNYIKTEVFGFEIPTAIDGVPSEILDPINTVSRYI